MRPSKTMADRGGSIDGSSRGAQLDRGKFPSIDVHQNNNRPRSPFQKHRARALMDMDGPCYVCLCDVAFVCVIDHPNRRGRLIGLVGRRKNINQKTPNGHTFARMTNRGPAARAHLDAAMR